MRAPPGQRACLEGRTEHSFWRAGEAAPGLESAFHAADRLCQTLSGWSAGGYQVPAASEVDRGKVVGEKVAPAGTIHGKAMMRYLPAWTAGSRSLSTRASSTSAERMDRPRNGEVRSSSGPAASRCPGLARRRGARAA